MIYVVGVYVIIYVYILFEFLCDVFIVYYIYFYVFDGCVIIDRLLVFKYLVLYSEDFSF